MEIIYWKIFQSYSFETKKLQAFKTKRFVEEQLGRCMNELSETEHEVKRFEEGQKIPSVSANTSRIIADAAELDKQVKDIENAMATISMEQAKLRRSDAAGPFENDGKKPGIQAADSASRAGKNIVEGERLVDLSG